MDFSSSALVVSKYLNLITKVDGDSSNRISEIGKTTPLPLFTEETLIKLAREGTDVIQKQPVLLNLSTEITLIGDLHGNIRDLIRIFWNTGSPSNTKFLFLGDYVDRGEHSIEVITLLTALLVQYPDNIFLIRGNHEFTAINSQYGFLEQVQKTYSSDQVWEAFNGFFNFMPIAAVIENTYFCVHGGISPMFNNVSQILQFKRPIFSYDEDELLVDLVWSDPITSMVPFSQSGRGHGCLFNDKAIANFLKNNKIKKLIRGHQCINQGVEMQLNGMVVTVFSSSNYCFVNENFCGILKIDQSLKLNAFNLPKMEILQRNDTHYCAIDGARVYPRPIRTLSSNITGSVVRNSYIKTKNSKITSSQNYQSSPIKASPRLTVAARRPSRVFVGTKASQSLPSLPTDCCAQPPEMDPGRRKSILEEGCMIDC